MDIAQGTELLTRLFVHRLLPVDARRRGHAIEVRINADTEIIGIPEGKSIFDVIHQQSRDADLVFLGLNDPEPGSVEEYARRMEQLAEGLGPTVFVRNAGEFAGKLV